MEFKSITPSHLYISLEAQVFLVGAEDVLRSIPKGRTIRLVKTRCRSDRVKIVLAGHHLQALHLNRLLVLYLHGTSKVTGPLVGFNFNRALFLCLHVSVCLHVSHLFCYSV